MKDGLSSLYINGGSGQRPFGVAPDGKHWCNVDINMRWNPDLLADIRSMFMFADSSAKMIVYHHCAEHAGCGEFHPAFAEAFRILEPAGSLLVCVPDMRELARRWLLKEMDDQLYFTNVYGAYNGDEADRHAWGFTGPSLSKALMDAAPWKTVKSFDWRCIPGADIARDWWVLGVEAIK